MNNKLITYFALSADNPWGCFTYPIVHVSWLHLLINLLALVLMYAPVRNIYCCRFNRSHIHFLLVIYICTVLAGLCASADTPTVGASGIVFTLLGMLLMLNPTRRQLRNYIYVAFAVLIQLFWGHSNIALHIIAFAFGVIAVILPTAYRLIHNDSTNDH